MANNIDVKFMKMNAKTTPIKGTEPTRRKKATPKKTTKKK